MDGLNVVALGAFEGNIWGGETKVTMGIYIDERADEGQREALQIIFSGQAGGWPGEFADVIGEVRGIEFVPITFEIADDLAYWAAEVPGQGERAGRGADRSDDPPRASGFRFTTLRAPRSGPGQIATWGTATIDRADGFGFKWEWDGRSSKHFPFDWSGP